MRGLFPDDSFTGHDLAQLDSECAVAAYVAHINIRQPCCPSTSNTILLPDAALVLDAARHVG